MRHRRLPPGNRLPFAFLLSLFLMGVGLTACGLRPSGLPACGPPVDIGGGKGRTITQRIKLPSPYSRISFRYQGAHNFMVKAHYVDIVRHIPEQISLVNAIGNYQGTVFLASAEPVKFDVVADGEDWSARIEGIAKAQDLTAWSGEGDWVSDFFESPEPENWRITHTGRGNFIVRRFCLDGSEKLIVNKIGSYSERVQVKSGVSPCIWIVNADGPWSISSKK